MAAKAGLVLAATIAGAAASVVSAGASIMGAMRAGEAADFEADLAAQQAEQEQAIARRQAADFRHDEKRRRASFLAQQAGRGRQVTGTTLLSLDDFVGEAELAAKTILAGGSARATRLQQQAQLTRMSGRTKRAAGFARAGTTLLTGASEFAGGYGDYLKLKT